MEDDDSDAEMADYGTDFSDDAEQLARMERDWAARSAASHHGPGNGGCCEVGQPAAAGALFDATARDDQHE